MDGDAALRSEGGADTRPYAGWSHETRPRGCQAGGVSVYTGPTLRNRASARKTGVSAAITDNRGWGRFHGIMLLGKKRNGTQKAVGLIATYAPCPNGSAFQWQKGQLEKMKAKNTDPCIQTARDMEKAMEPHAHPQ